MMRMQFKFKNRRGSGAVFAGLVLLFTLVFLVACEEYEGSKYNPPADHAISKEGVMHKSGLDQPLTNCASCHGADLQGGTAGVSCYECHGKKW
ncbi:MAG: hypothetical protein R2751_04415 [Bacteroidales bacterium]